MLCTLCHSDNLKAFHRDEKRSWTYFVCEECDFVFRDPESYLKPTDEKARYETHNNSIENEGYVKFLSPSVEILLPHLKEGDEGLDYGSGPGPILDTLFERKGFKVSNYDPHFQPNEEVLKKTYDFVTCTEVFEHFYEPNFEMRKISELVKPGGFLVIMSEHRRDPEHFAGWGYRTDNTHVCFLNDESLYFICERWDYELLSSDGRLSLLRKNS